LRLALINSPMMIMIVAPDGFSFWFGVRRSR